MRFDLSSEHKMLRKTIQEFRENEMEPLLADEDPDATNIPIEKEEKLRKKAKKAGLWAMAIPEEYGGGGLDILGRAIVMEELSKHRLGLYNAGLGGVELTPGITVGSPETYLDTATEYHFENYFQPAFDGDLNGAFALTEPSGGSDPANMQTKAVKDGDEWVINGEKRFISRIGYFDYAMLFAKAFVDGEEAGITGFLVDTDMDGWNISRQMDTIRPLDPFEIHIKDLRVPDKNRFGEVGKGFKIASSGVRANRVMYSAAHIGVATVALEKGLEYAKERETFGKPLSERQSIRWMLADSAVDIHRSRLCVYDCAWKAEQGMDVRHEASMIKVESSEMLGNVLDRVIQIHGGVGVCKDLPLERWYREGRIRRIGEGPSEIQRRTIARNLVKGYEPVDLLEKVINQ